MSQIANNQVVQSYLDSGKLPPVEKWNPPLCGHSEIKITKTGQWLHQGKPLTRQPLIKLFASIIKKEGHDYFLVTPAEKLTLDVELTPFIIVDCKKDKDGIRLISNLGEACSLQYRQDLFTMAKEGEPIICANIRGKLPAAINSSTLQQLVDWSEEKESGQIILTVGQQHIDLSAL